MWYGKNTDELSGLRTKYEEMFGYDPDGEMDLEYGESDYKDYIHDIKKAIREKKHLIEIVD